MECLEDADVSIRLQALELAARMVTSDTLQPVVNRLISQLTNPSRSTDKDLPDAESDDSGNQVETRKADCSFTLPNEYRIEVLHRILDICSHDNYSELPDFEWYIEILVQLVKLLPRGIEEYVSSPTIHQESTSGFERDAASRIGYEIRNVAVRVRSVRMETTRAAESLVITLISKLSSFNDGILGPLAWIVGEYAEYLQCPGRTLHSLIDTSNLKLPAKALSLCLQAIPKVLVHIIHDGETWDASFQIESSLFLARVIEFLEPLSAHPDLEVQERAIEFLEVFRLAAEVIHSDTCQSQEMPFLLSSVIPSLFMGLELNPVAVTAQRKVPFPERLILDQSFNDNLSSLFRNSISFPGEENRKPLQSFYHFQDIPNSTKQFSDTARFESQLATYQNLAGTSSTDEVTALARRRAERKGYNRDDPFYIGTADESSGTSTPFHQVFNASNGAGLDIDSIPIIDLKVNEEGGDHRNPMVDLENPRKPMCRSQQYDIAVDETIGNEDPMEFGAVNNSGKAKRSLLQIDSSGLGKLSLGDYTGSAGVSKTEEDDNEMNKAMQEVEKVRLKMQRASERVNPEGIPAEGMLVRKKKKRERKSAINNHENDGILPNDHGILMNNDVQQGHSGSVIQKKKKRVKKRLST
ncbi:hypothetical protein AWENTII_008463 [Aspergillus wentii]|nr:AP-3 complex subunit delta [Aspergillus wentii]